MNRDDDREGEVFEERLRALLSIRDKTPSDSEVLIWWVALEPWPIEEVLDGFSKFLRDPDAGRYPPTPAAIIGQIEVGKEAAALAAFDSVWRAISDVGPYSGILFDDPAISKTIEDLGGWEAVCRDWTVDERPFRQQEFCTRWKGYRKSGAGQARILVGANTDGACARVSYDRHGHSLQPVRLAQDEALALIGQIGHQLKIGATK